MTSPFKGWTLHKKRRIAPSLIAQEIVSVQPMSQPIFDIFKAFPIFSKFATNSDGFIFRFTPSIGKDEEKQLAIFKISFLMSKMIILKSAALSLILRECLMV
jgi:hypothetical protein